MAECTTKMYIVQTINDYLLCVKYKLEESSEIILKTLWNITMPFSQLSLKVCHKDTFKKRLFYCPFSLLAETIFKNIQILPAVFCLRCFSFFVSNVPKCAMIQDPWMIIYSQILRWLFEILNTRKVIWVHLLLAQREKR